MQKQELRWTMWPSDSNAVRWCDVGTEGRESLGSKKRMSRVCSKMRYSILRHLSQWSIISMGETEGFMDPKTRSWRSSKTKGQFGLMRVDDGIRLQKATSIVRTVEAGYRRIGILILRERFDESVTSIQGWTISMTGMQRALGMKNCQDMITWYPPVPRLPSVDVRGQTRNLITSISHRRAKGS